MTKTNFSDAALLDLTLDRELEQPLFDQLVQALRHIILGGRLGPGSKLPSSRKLATDLSVSRVTVITAYDQLIAEGYIEGRPGSGVFVTKGLPDPDLVNEIAQDFCLNDRDPMPPEPLMAFQPNSPDMRLFPHKQWAKLFQQIWSNPRPDLLNNPDPLGWWPLRVQIAEHLRVWRGINCQPEQVVITSGASEAIQTIAESLFQPRQLVAVEEPGYNLFTRVLSRLHIHRELVPVDEQGISINVLRELKGRPVCAITTPSRQYPLGITMPLARRLQLLEWAAQDNRFVIEDDYDSEYRYVGQPLPALMSLAREGAVIYLGSFSKVFSKALRLGYLVVPQSTLPSVRVTLSTNGSNAAGLAQPVLSKFIESGAYASHLRRMRRIYSARQKIFIRAARRYLSGLIEFEPAGGGMHLVGKIGARLHGKMSDVDICSHALKAGVALKPLSKNYNGPNRRQGVIAGYAGFDENQLNSAIIRLAKALEIQ